MLHINTRQWASQLDARVPYSYKEAQHLTVTHHKHFSKLYEFKASKLYTTDTFFLETAFVTHYNFTVTDNENTMEA